MAGPDIEAAAPAAEGTIVTPEVEAACKGFVVVGQEVELDVNFRDRSVSGVSHILIFPFGPDELEEIVIDARQFEIDTKNIRVDGCRTVATYTDPYDLLEIPSDWTLGATQHHIAKNRMRSLIPERRPDIPVAERDELIGHTLGCVPADGSLKISIRPSDLVKDDAAPPHHYPEAKPDSGDKAGVRISVPFRSKRIRDGWQFVGIEEGDTRYPHVYTRHSIQPGTAACIFPCVDDIGLRQEFKVSIKFPRTLGHALEQPLATQQAANGLVNGSGKRKQGDPPPRQPQSVLLEEDKLLEMTIISSGVLIGEHVDPEDDRKKVMTFECQNTAARHVGFAIGPFEHVALWHEYRTEEADEKLTSNSTKVHGYCLPGRADELRNTCAPIVAAADYFALEFGKYPFDSYKICFLDDMVGDTAEASSLSLCSNRLLYPPEIIDKDIHVTRKLVHSLACQYFGVHIVPSKRSDTWLVVAIQWYITDLFLKTLCGNNWYRFHLKTLSDKLVRQDIERPSLHDLGEYLHVGDFELDFMSLKAPLVLHILDQRMSKYPGSIGIGRVISHLVSTANISNTESRSTSLSSDEFRKACAKKTQYKLEEFWQQWIRQAGCPRFLIKAKFNKKNLNVDITVVQTQGDARFHPGPRLLDKEDFWREFQEEIHNVYAGEITKKFSGPCTVRIHEADGTPYEHYLDVREADKNGHMWVIPYNTKYKRLKRKSRKEAGNNTVSANNLDAKNDLLDDDVVYFNMLGDVLQSDEDVKNWGLSDWDAEVQGAMDQESYEWIRFDCNFEWLCDIITDMPPYMYLAQLQQDRDVVAHQDAMLAFRRAKPSAMGSSIDIRTLFDKRYYHGIRTMAAKDLPKHAIAPLGHIGMVHLIIAFRQYFCARVVMPGGENYQPLPNDFTDRAQYFVQCSMLDAIARVRKEKGRCPKPARDLLLNLIVFNDNSTNEYSDHFYVAYLLEAVTTAAIPEPNEEDDRPYIQNLNNYDDDDIEFKKFIETTLGFLDRFRRQDEWDGSYQNIWTTTALECKKRLMKERVIPVAPLEFLAYLQDENTDLVRIKAFECLVELGMLSRPSILKFLLATMSTDSSPFVRERLFKIFCEGIASIALAENKPAEPTAPVPAVAEDADDGGLIIEQGEAITDARRKKAARREDINAALKGLKEDLKGNVDLQLAMWKAVASQTIGLDEERRYLELCEAMFDQEDALLLTLKYPSYWTCTREPTIVINGDRAARKRCIVTFTLNYRTAPTKKAALPEIPPPPPPPAEETMKPPEPKKIKLQSRPSFSAATGSAARTSLPPAPLVRTPSISVSSPKPEGRDFIAVHSPAIRTATPATVRVATPPPRAPSLPIQQPLPAVSKSSEKKQKPQKKRKSDEVAEPNERPKKMVKTESQSGALPRHKLEVKVKFNSWERLPKDIYETVLAEQRGLDDSTIIATPVSMRPAQPQPRIVDTSSSPTVDGSPPPPRPPRAPLPTQPRPNGSNSTGKPRKPLPSGPSHAQPSQVPATPMSTAPPASTRGLSPAAPASSAAAAPPKKMIIKLKIAKKEPQP